VNGEHKITSSHRERAALIYLRQSSMAQLREHTESTRSQYALADKAAALGWPRSDIEVIDTDLGVSGKWGVAREGFTELVTRVCSGEVGAIFGIEITRLARSNADVARLAEFARHALEPEWEARFEPRSYGFRPGRGCHDAIAAIYNACKGPVARRVWALDADLAAAFDRIGHDHLLASLGSFPARDLIRDWLKAGVFEPGKGFAPTEEATPQGGVISPCLLNAALHGLEEAAGVRYRTRGPRVADTERGSPVAVRYADDVVVLCHSQEQAGHIKARLAEWLAPRGLAFNEDKTRIVHLSEGFGFLGFNARRYPNRKLLIKPSQAAIRRVRERLACELRTLRGANAMAVIARLNPIVRGWAAYYRGVVSSRLFSSLDHYLWHITCKWATWRRASKPKHWITRRYFGKFNKFRNDH
jgi:RNA-directed DNA polymerase